MERIVKILSVMLLSICCILPVCADTADTSVQVQTDISQCIKTYQVPYDKLYYLTLAGVNEYNYSIKEIQPEADILFLKRGTENIWPPLSMYLHQNQC